jgi:Protein of unknown function (DUF3179)
MFRCSNPGTRHRPPLSFAAPPYLEFLLLDFPVCPSCLSKRLLIRFGYKLPPVDDLLLGRIVRFFHSFHSRQSLREVAFCFVSVHNGACTCWNSQPEEGSLMKKRCALALVWLALALGATGARQKQAEPLLPYTAVHDPQFIPASSANFLHDPDRVIGVMAGTVAKAYPAAILSQHGLVEDQSPSGPIAVTW